jgi:hypothetical protein
MTRFAGSLRVIGLLLVAGCASPETEPTWLGGLVPEVFRRDNYDCVREATYAKAESAASNRQALANDRYITCMESRGYLLRCKEGLHLNRDNYKCER